MSLTKNWWLFLLRGILALIFGLVAIFFPIAAFTTLVFVFGAFALADGIFAIVSALTSQAKSENWWWLVLGGLFGILIGILTLLQPAVVTGALLLLIAAWAIVTGLFQIITAIRLRKEITGEFWLILSGLFSVIFGVLVILSPAAGAFTIGFLIGIYALVFGVTLIMLAFRLRKHGVGIGDAA